eukprot:scaffold11553_cov39-Cyclotella_meneghiniana.AAC.7
MASLLPSASKDANGSLSEAYVEVGECVFANVSKEREKYCFDKPLTLNFIVIDCCIIHVL